MLDGTGLRRFDLRVPRLEGLDGEERAFVEAYIHAEVYNIISALGGKRMAVHFDQGRAKLAAILERLPAVFGIGLPRSARSGYGRAVNVTDRMAAAMSPGRVSLLLRVRAPGAGPGRDPTTASRGGPGRASSAGGPSGSKAEP